MTQMHPYNPHSKEREEGCRCYMIATMWRTTATSRSGHDTDASL